MPEAAQSGASGSFLPGFSNDIFLSYAHFDNRPSRPDLDQRGWVDRFVGRLKNVLEPSLGASVKIWRDDSDLKRADEISPTIQSAIDGSALFLVLVSSRYLNSKSCRNEVRWIDQQCRQRATAIRGERVFPILLYRIPEADRPVICLDKVGFDFFEAAEDTGLGRPLDPELMVGRFTEKLNRLVTELDERLRALSLVRPPRRTSSTVSDAYRVLITGTPGVPRRQRERLQKALTNENEVTDKLPLPPYDVVNEPVPPPYKIKEHEDEFAQLLEGVRMSVHLVDEQPGPVVEGATDLCFPEVQCRLAHARGLQQLVVLPEFVDLEAVEVPSHRKFIEELNRGVWPAEGKGEKLTVLKAPTEDAIRDVIRQEREKAFRARPASPVAGGSVFIELNTIDLRAVAPLFEFLAGLRLEPITIPSTESSPAECRTFFVDNVTRSNALIIVYGEATLDWVKSRTLNAIRLIIERELPLKPIVAALPPVKRLDALAFLQCPIVDCTAGFNEASLSALLGGGRP